VALQLSTPTWRDTRSRVLARDGNRCTVARLLGGTCAPPPFHVHHIVPRGDGGTDDLDNLATACASHHPIWEALRRQVVRRMTSEPVRCPHVHRTAEARRICESRLARRAA